MNRRKAYIIDKREREKERERERERNRDTERVKSLPDTSSPSR